MRQPSVNQTFLNIAHKKPTFFTIKPILSCHAPYKLFPKLKFSIMKLLALITLLGFGLFVIPLFFVFKVLFFFMLFSFVSRMFWRRRYFYANYGGHCGHGHYGRHGHWKHRHAFRPLTEEEQEVLEDYYRNKRKRRKQTDTPEDIPDTGLDINEKDLV